MAKPGSRVALVTGGTKGIGLAVARAMVQAGNHVAVSARSESDVQRVAAELGGLGSGEAHGIVCDVRDPVACADMVESAVRRFGALDVLVNNAGLGIFAPIQEMSVEDFQVQIETNLCGVFYCSKAAVPHLAAGAGGWIINLGSLAGRNAFPRATAYNASKFGLRGLSEAMMLDLRYENIRVSHIMPGSVNTEFAGNETGSAGAWKLQPDDVARAVVDLLDYPGNALPSKIEMRPSQPPQR
jgi:NAD(P)-dependent dehydrogenase (short-subunit alcohol dehydrogenase family)